MLKKRQKSRVQNILRKFAEYSEIIVIVAQKLIQTQKQEQKLQQRLSQQQMLQVKLLEMPLAEFEESITMELDDNPALETVSTEDALYEEAGVRSQESVDGSQEEESFEEQTEREERQDALEKALEGIGRDDDMPETFNPAGNNQTADYEEMVYGDTVSFYDKLKEQIGEQDLDETEREVMEYLIGSLDDDGLLRKDLDTLSDELAVYYNIYVTADEIGQVLRKLQTFDPAGIGARSLQECLLLQVERKPAGWLKTQLKRVFHDHFDAFTKKHWQKIQDALDLSDDQVAELQDEIRK